MKTTLTILSLCCLFSLTATGQEANLQELVSRKQFASIVEQAGRLTAADSANYQTMYAFGQAYEGLLQYREAYRYFQHCLSMDTANVDILNTLARTATNLGRAGEAERYFLQILANDSTNFNANYQLARLYQQLGDYDRSLDKYGALLDRYPDNTTILRNMGDIYVRMESWGEAVAPYMYAYLNNRENAGLASSLINVMLRLGSGMPLFVVEALSICDTALYHNPNNMQLRRDKGMALYMSRQFAAADTVYTALMEAGDSTYNTLKYGGASKYYAGQYLKSIRPLELAYEIDTTAIDVNIFLGSALGKTYDRKRAYVLFNQAEELMKPDRSLANMLLQSRAETLRRDGRTNESMALYYQLWQKTERLSHLQTVVNWFQGYNATSFQTEDSKQRAFFFVFLYINVHLERGGKASFLYPYRGLLASLYEDMFFRNVTEEQLLAPDGKKSSVNVIDVRQLMKLIPDTPPSSREVDTLLERET